MRARWHALIITPGGVVSHARGGGVARCIRARARARPGGVVSPLAAPGGAFGARNRRAPVVSSIAPASTPSRPCRAPRGAGAGRHKCPYPYPSRGARRPVYGRIWRRIRRPGRVGPRIPSRRGGQGIRGPPRRDARGGPWSAPCLAAGAGGRGDAPAVENGRASRGGRIGGGVRGRGDAPARGNGQRERCQDGGPRGPVCDPAGGHHARPRHATTGTG